jgi:two-component system chemotaxis sensor kinase CheA
MSKYLGLFVSEATEHLEALGRDLVRLERTTASDDVSSMFRHAHSVKGMASSMGFESLAQVAHRLEDLLDAVRTDPSRADQSLVDLLLAATDNLLDGVKAVGAGRSLDDSESLLADLGARFTALTGAPPAKTRVAEVSSPAPEPPRGRPQRFLLRARVASTCQAPGVRAFLVHKRLSLLGHLFDSKPALEDLKAGRIPDGMMTFDLETTAGQEGLEQALRNVAEVELVSATVIAAPPANDGANGEATRSPPQDPGRTVRIRTELLDYFLETAGELLIATSRMRELARTLPAAHRPQLEEEVYRLQAEGPPRQGDGGADDPHVGDHGPASSRRPRHRPAPRPRGGAGHHRRRDRA